MRFINARNSSILRELVTTDFKLRYQGSVLGYFWSLLKPLFLFAIMYVVFVHFLKFGQGVSHFASMLLLGIVLWSFFTEATVQGMQSIVSRGDLLRKINFPKYLLVISATVSALINFILNLLVVFIIMLIDGIDFGWAALLFPFTVLLLYGFALSIAFFLASLNVKYRDAGHIWEIILQALFYATPIFYPIQMVIKFNIDAAKLLMLNPIAVLIQQGRYELIGKENVITASMLSDNMLFLTTPYVLIFSFALCAVWYFRIKQGKFAEWI